MTVENTQAVDQSAYLQVLNQANAGTQATQAQQFSNTLKKIQVKYGDTVSELAEQYGTTTDAIVQANNLRDPNFILAGQNLVIPAKGQSVQAVSRLRPSNQRVVHRHLSLRFLQSELVRVLPKLPHVHGSFKESLAVIIMHATVNT